MTSVYFCDGPACLTSVEDCSDTDDLVAAGWLLVTFTGEDDDDYLERNAHLCSHTCLVAWAAEEAAEEVEA